jgi:hypothetical protein
MTPQYDDDYDPEELRRRQALNYPSIEDNPVSRAAALVLAPDEEEADGPSTVTPTSQAATKYAQLLQNRPQRADYKPSKLARVGAALSGLGEGIRGVPGAGTHSNLNAKYDAAIQEWEQNLSGAQNLAALEEKHNQELINQQRAKAYAVSAQARQAAAEAVERDRQFRESQPRPLTPFEQYQQNPDAYTKFEQALHPRNPTEFDQYNQDPDAYTKFESTRHPLDPNRETFEQRQQLQQEHERSETSRQAAHDAREAALRRELAKPPQEKTQTPQSQAQAEQLAVRDLLRTNPEYSKFVEPLKDSKGNLVGHSVMSQENAANVDEKWWQAKDPQRITRNRDTYRQFLMDLDKRKQEISGKQRGDVWEIKPQQE